MYYIGQGCEVDYSKAIKYYQLAADQGNVDVQFNLGLNISTHNFIFSHLFTIGVMYYIGQGCAVDYSKAMKYFQLAADQGDSNGQHNLGCNISSHDSIFSHLFTIGLMYYNGKGCAVDYSNAIKYFQLAADQGDVSAQVCLGCNISSHGCIFSPLFTIGLMYYNGEGCAVDYSKAMKYFQLAADQGDSNGQHNLGCNLSSHGSIFSHLFTIGKMNYNGKGCAVDCLKAIKYYQLAADQGHAEAQSNLG